MTDEIEIRKEAVINYFKNNTSLIYYGLLAIIIWLGFFIRTRNLSLLIDATTGGYVPADPDAMVIFRYSQYVLENGFLPAVDMLRSFPLGFTGMSEFTFMTHSIVYVYKFLSIFSSTLTFDYIFAIFPAIAFIFAMLMFFLTIKKLFSNTKIALIATAFLSFAPAFLFRTMSGIADKESLATFLLFASFYFFVSSWKSKTMKHSLIYAVLAGIFTGFTATTWGGANFIFLIFGLFALVETILDKFSKRELYSFIIWFVLTIITTNLIYPGKINFGTIVTSVTTIACLMAIFVGLIRHFVLSRKEINDKVEKYSKLPKSINGLIIFMILSLIYLVIFSGPAFLLTKLKDVYLDVTKPFGGNRWVLTVAENHQPFVSDWVAQFGGMFIVLSFIVGSILLFYSMVKKLSKSNKIKLTIAYSIFIFLFIFSRYKPDSILNGENFISNLLYLGSLFFFVAYFFYIYLRSYFKDREEYEKLISLDKTTIFSIIWFLVMAIAARSAVRLIYIFTSIAVVLIAYLIYVVSVYLIEKINQNKKETTNRVFLIAVLVIFLMVFFWPFGSPMSQFPVLGKIPVLNSNGYLINYYQTSLSQNTYSGSTYHQQWQQTGFWMRENTPQDAVFAHWWDYGYLVQSNNRATITDGGNTIGAWNYWLGRHVLTGHSDIEALQFLKAHNTTNLLIVSDEIGKYPAYSSIGSDQNYDRYSWINVFTLQQDQIRETRNTTVLLYAGGTSLDQDIIYQDKFYPKGQAGIGAFFLPLANVENASDSQVEQPSMVLVYNGQQVQIPLNCVFIGNTEVKFTGGIDACIRILPTINNGQINQIGSLLYLSPEVYQTQFTKLYLFNKDTEYFKLAYSDESQVPLSLYNGRLIGPHKIWDITYPDDLEVPEHFYGVQVLDPSVYEVG
jgi:asparagine N-glycosylation enzyme membrane subunit Stt3